MCTTRTDVQSPFRFPITPETHSRQCKSMQTCCSAKALHRDVVEAAQAAQDAQCGYACDYQNKRDPMAFSEVKEFLKGHRNLKETLTDHEVHRELVASSADYKQERQERESKAWRQGASVVILTHALLELHGCGGSAKKKRRFSQNAMSVVQTTQTPSTSGPRVGMISTFAEQEKLDSDGAAGDPREKIA